MFRSQKLLWLAILSIPITPSLIAQQILGPSTPAADVMVRQSGYIFSGSVTAVKRIVAANSAVDSVQITFHVDRGIRGVHDGETLTVREWIGLWQQGERYTPGQRVMLFLYRPSKLGLTSPVGGSLGRMDIDRNGQVIPRWGWPSTPGSPILAPRQSNRISVTDFARSLPRQAGD